MIYIVLIYSTKPKHTLEAASRVEWALSAKRCNFTSFFNVVYLNPALSEVCAAVVYDV